MQDFHSPKQSLTVRIRRVTAVVLGVSYAFVFYAFQYLIREFLRIMSLSEDHDIWLLSDDEVYFYNWFFAALALIMGQSILLAHWFERPKEFRKRSVLRRTTILNDQRFLQVNFLMWFLKLGFLYALFFGITWPYSHYDFSFYPGYAFILVFIILILFFQSWNTIRLKFNGKSYKWMLFSFFTIFVFSFALAKIDIVDYKAFNKAVLEENIFYGYDLQLSEADNADQIFTEPNSILPHYIFCDKENSNLIKIKIDDRICPFVNEFGYQGLDIFGWHGPSFEEKLNIDFRFYIDKRIQMKYIWLLWNDLLEEDIIRVSYGLYMTGSDLPQGAFKNYGISLSIPLQFNDSWDYHPKDSDYDTIPNHISILHHQEGSCQVNGDEVLYENLESKLFELMMVEPNFMIIYDLKGHLTFDDYIQFRMCARKAVRHLRNTYCWDMYGAPCEPFSFERQLDMKKKFPMRILDVSIPN